MVPHKTDTYTFESETYLNVLDQGYTNGRTVIVVAKISEVEGRSRIDGSQIGRAVQDSIVVVVIASVGAISASSGARSIVTVIIVVLSHLQPLHGRSENCSCKSHCEDGSCCETHIGSFRVLYMWLEVMVERNWVDIEKARRDREALQVDCSI